MLKMKILLRRCNQVMSCAAARVKRLSFKSKDSRNDFISK